ncbi:MAG: POTRA domain-containing protein [Balneola sp.]
MIKYISIFILLCTSIDAFAQVDTVTVFKSNFLSYKTPVIVPEGMSTLEALKRNFRNNGFLDIKVEQVNEKSFRISNDRRYTISNFTLTLDGDSVLQNPVLNAMQFYNEQAINAALEAEYSKYIAMGYLNANVVVSRIDLDSLNKNIELQADVNRGELTKVSSVLFNGNEINSQEYLSKISGVTESIVANRENLIQIRENLIASGLFQEVSDAQVFQDEGEPVIVFAVEETIMNQLDGLLGYVPDASGKGQIVGDLAISLWNVLSDGNAFELMYQRLRPETSRLELGISQNWIGEIPLMLGLNFGFYQNDTTYQTRNIGLHGNYFLTPNFSLDGRIYSLNSNSSRSTGFQQEPDGKKQGTDLGFTFSTLDRPEVPTQGIRLKMSYGVASKDIESDSSVAFRQQKIESAFSSYVKIGNQSVIATSINGFYVIGDRFTESDLIRFGGANSFRGYSEEQFTASELLWGDVEYRFLTDRDSYLFAFGATGYYNRPQLASEQNNTFTQSDFLYSGGLGISYKTRIGRLTFTYALSPSETISNGKVHFGIRTSL